eukprot:XP_012821217.1 PREDICTED: obscurin-like isoform X2 [Xenopus tropicalis]
MTFIDQYHINASRSISNDLRQCLCSCIKSGVGGSIRASLERADQEIRQVLQKLVETPGTGLMPPQLVSPKGLGTKKSAAVQSSVEERKAMDMFRDANTQTPEDQGEEKKQMEQKETTETHEIPTASQKQEAPGVPELHIPIRLGMEASDWYLRRAPAHIWDVRSQVYIESTETTCVHFKDDKATRPPYMQVTIEDVHTQCGDAARFDAVIEGTAPLTIAWYKNNVPLTECERIQIVKEDRKYSLILRDTKPDDGAIYTCVARNMGGEVSCKAELVMHEDTKEHVTETVQKRRKLKSFFEVKEEIGRGCFGFVKRVVHKGNGANCAAKFIPLRSKTRQRAYRERELLSEISHSNITCLLDAFETRKTLILIMDICCGEELLDRLFKKSIVSEREVKVYIRQLVEAIGYLHDKDILHLDVKPANILMVNTDQDDIKLCDFGFAQKRRRSEPQYSKYGSPEFVSPEIASQLPVSEASDIWPIGVITYLCLVCASPFAGQNDRETLLSVQQGKISWHNQGFIELSEEAKDFIRRTIQMSPESRPSAVECSNHKWFQGCSGEKDTRPIITKGLKFLVARSRWQRSLMCYRSILVMRSIPELLQGNVERTSLGVPRHLVEGSSSSSSSGSSSDNESDISPTARGSNPSLELHLSIFKMYDRDTFQEVSQKADIITQEEKRSQEATLVCSDKSGAQETDKVNFAEDTVNLEQTDKMLVESVETSPGKRPFCKAATIEVGDLASKKGKSGCFVRGSSADSALLGVDRHTLVCVPRQSIINSTFYSQSGEGAGLTPRDGALREKEFIKHREKARRSLMKAGYSQKILSGLREPLLEQFAMEQRIIAQDKAQATQEGPSGSLKKSVSFDGSKGSPRSSFKASSRSRSLDDCKSRPLTVYKGVLLEEGGQKVSVGDKILHTNTQCHSEETATQSDFTQGITDSIHSRVQPEVPHAAKEHQAPLFISSTQRPLSATTVDSENTIIAVLHQQPIFDSGSVKERPPSLALEVEESTVIAFLQQKPLLFAEPSKTHVDTEGIKDSIQPQETGLPSQFEGPTPHLGGSVTFTVKTTSDTNYFLASQPPVEKYQVGSEVGTETSVNQESTVSPDSTMESTPYVVQFTDSKSSTAIIPQGLQKDPPLLKATKERAVVTVTEATAVTEKVEEKCSITNLDTFSPENLHLSTQHGDVILKPSISEHQELGSTSERHCEIIKDVSRQNTDENRGSSLYSDEQSAALEDLVGEMTYLSEQMNVLAGNQEQISNIKSTEGKTQVERGPLDPGLAMETEVLIVQTSASPQASKEPQLTSVSQCSFYDSLCPAQASPLLHEEEFSIESRSSSKTFISHSDSSETGRRSDNFSDFEEAGRHSEVSLLEIEELNYNSPSTSSVGPFHFEPTQSHLLDFYGIKESPRNSEDPSQEKPLSDNEKLNLNSQPLLGGKHDTKIDERTMEKVSKKEEIKERKSSSSRKRIKLFRPHSKTDSSGKSSDQSLKQKVKASVANISRIIKGKPSNGQERKEGIEGPKADSLVQAATERIAVHMKKKSFKLTSLSPKDKAPAFVEELTDQTVVVGHLVTLSCRTSEPVTEVEWFKDGVPIQGNERVLISSTLKNYHLLTILVVMAQDLGIYACVASNSLGSASTCCILKRAEIPCCPTSPEVAQVYKDGALIVWKPVESASPVTYFVQYRKEGEEWRPLTLDISDCCYSTHVLSEGQVYSFRIACISKAGMGPYSNPSAGVRIGRPSQTFSKEMGSTEETVAADRTSTLQTGVTRGRFSSVRPCKEKSSGRLFAAKIIPYTDKSKESTLQEYLILKQLHHSNIVQLHGAFLSPHDLVLILELCEGLELLQFLSLGPSYSELEVRDYLWQMLSAVEFLHAKQILHLDLRSENTIVTEHKLLKILDFGNACVYSPDKLSAPQRYRDYVETMAPEVLEGQGAVPPTDIWAVGITAFIMLSSDYPFSSDTTSELEKGIKKGLIRFTRCYAGLSGGAVSFLQSTLWANPWGRPSASDCLKFLWLQEAGLATFQQAPIFFPSSKLKNFLRERRKRTQQLATL